MGLYQIKEIFSVMIAQSLKLFSFKFMQLSEHIFIIYSILGSYNTLLGEEMQKL